MTSKVLQVSVWRGGPDGAYQTFQVPQRDSQTVLDVVTHIQRHIDGTLSYRYACRVGMCGSCAMMVNGVPRWTCRSHVSNFARNGALELAPLANLPVIKDLTVDMTRFFEKWQLAQGVFHGATQRSDGIAAIKPDMPGRVSVDEAIECINCGVCYAGCDTVRWNPDYLGPAALNRAWSLINDERDAGKQTRLQVLAGEGGCFNCHSHQSCQAFCPKQLNPARSIAGLKKAALRAGG
jgi:fumarate reductase iron-sulfur subunit